MCLTIVYKCWTKHKIQTIQSITPHANGEKLSRVSSEVKLSSDLYLSIVIIGGSYFLVVFEEKVIFLANNRSRKDLSLQEIYI